MGISCSILFRKNSNISVMELYNTIKNICMSNNFFLDISTKNVDVNQKIKSIYSNISDVSFTYGVMRQLCVSLFDEPYQFKDISFDWYNQKVIFFEAIVIDNIEDNEDLLLKITYELLSKYPEAVLWLEQNWFYKLDDIKKYILNEFDPNWCYQNPHQS